MRVRDLGCATMAGFFLAATATPAQANPVGLALNMQAVMLTVSALGPGSMCTTITYDKNGNRIAVASNPMGGGAGTWGAGSFGCFVWGQ